MGFIKKLLKKWMGARKYCKMFHSSYSQDGIHYTCDKCNITRVCLNPDDLGPG
jgi:hypothetical protein